MFDHLKQLSKHANFFLSDRWNSPLHSQAATEAQNCLWPSSEELYIPLNPMFSVFFSEARQVGAYDVVFLRDGAHTLLDFYLRYPAPKKSRTLFLVHADLYFLVPDPWRAQTLAYRIDPRPNKKKKKLVFYALVSETFLGWNRFKHRFADWIKQFPADAEVSAYLALRNEPINHKWDEKTLPFEFTSALQNYFTNKIDFLTIEGFKRQGPNADATFVSFDMYRAGVGFCAMENLFMGQAINIHPRGVYKNFSGEKIGEWPLSFNHKMSIYHGDCPDSDYGTFFFMKKMNAYPLTPKLLDTLDQRLTFV